jgi:hypothetical protein
MHPSVKQAVERYLARSIDTGRRVSHAEIKELQARLTVPLPDWYVELLLTYPLAGLFLDYPLYEAEGEYDGFFSIEIANLQNIYSETEECHPGLAIKELGYACLAIDPTGGGDPYFMRVVEGDNPSVYQVYHDGGDVGTEIEAGGMVKIADSLAEFFDKGRAIR